MSSQSEAYSTASSGKTINVIGLKFDIVIEAGVDNIPTKFQLSSLIASMVFIIMVPIFWEFPFLKNSYLRIPLRYQKIPPFRPGVICREP